MNSLRWMAQILLASVFLFTAAGKLFAYEKVVKVVETRSGGRPIGMTRWQATVGAIAEIIGAIGLIKGPVEPPHLIVLCAAAWLALLMVAAGIYHLFRNESATPSVVLYLLALFILVGRWPR